MRRFWNEISLAALAEGFTLCLDGRQMRLADGAALLLPRRRVAEAVAAEWRALGEEFSPDDLPLTRLAGTARNRIAPDPAPTIAALARYGASDLLCYRAEAPATLARRQEALWQPWLDWAARTLDAPLAVYAPTVYELVTPRSVVIAVCCALDNVPPVPSALPAASVALAVVILITWP